MHSCLPAWRLGFFYPGFTPRPAVHTTAGRALVLVTFLLCLSVTGSGLPCRAVQQAVHTVLKSTMLLAEYN